MKLAHGLSSKHDRTVPTGKQIRRMIRVKAMQYQPPEPEELRGPDNCSNWFIVNDDLDCLTRCGKCRD